MTASTAVQFDAVWLSASDYSVAALNPKVSPYLPELHRALAAGLPAYPDGSRQDFYDIELDSGWAYIHVNESRRTVYLVAFSRT